MQIRMLTSIASEEWSYAAREVVDIADELAAKWVESGIAELVEDSGKPLIEQAVAENFESPESPRKRKK